METKLKEKKGKNSCHGVSVCAFVCIMLVEIDAICLCSVLQKRDYDTFNGRETMKECAKQFPFCSYFN